MKWSQAQWIFMVMALVLLSACGTGQDHGMSGTYYDMNSNRVLRVTADTMTWGKGKPNFYQARYRILKVDENPSSGVAKLKAVFVDEKVEFEIVKPLKGKTDSLAILVPPTKSPLGTPGSMLSGFKGMWLRR